MSDTIVITDDFAGPPFAANGGYVAGILAEHLGVSSAHVDLRAPAPLGRELHMKSEGPFATIEDRGRLVASAAAVSLTDLSAPRVDYITAALAAGDVDATHHPFPQCFVCGPDRSVDDGLHLLPGHIAEGVVAVPWRPSAAGARVSTRVVAAALDCPSAFAVIEDGEAALLASMTFQIARTPLVGEELVVTGWKRRTSGAKRWAATAITGPDGEMLAKAETLWLAVDADRLGAIEAAAAA